MSDLAAFWKQVDTDGPLKNEFDGIMNRSVNPVSASELVELGHRHGFEFTKDDLKATLAAAGTELSEAELEEVAGGSVPWQQHKGFKVEIEGVTQGAFKIVRPDGGTSYISF